ncbi:hypothetical protein [Spongiactinospora sp. TRM90649]|uniref:hypothetical protein n=1 Tax=Spongiactinospora sp. TRM90649 TaxID=3031114 RepID=UPI0023F90DFF|nr:hypothetical protein [Spongiactinospora sp. TRM90649]MDF5752646.1 hypothetical protein [Spongiactinospora sp. TRM90649]
MSDRLDFRPHRRQIAQADRHSGFVAIDFGTTNTTMTLYDRNLTERLPLPAAQHLALVEALSSLLADGLPAADRLPERHAAEWQALLAEIAVDQVGRPDVTALVAMLTATTSANPAGLHGLIRDLDRRSATCSEPVRRWLRYRLHRCHEAAFTTPALKQRFLHVVTFDDMERSEVVSRVEVRDEDPLSVVLHRFAAGAEKPPLEVLNLKHLVTRTPPADFIDQDGRRIKTKGMLAAVVDFLLERGDTFVKRGRPAFGPGLLDHIVLTYPTMAPPDVRRVLRSTVRDILGVTLVDTDYDEAIAAALFFLMRDLGPHYGSGLEALRARYRPVRRKSRGEGELAVVPGEFEENVLVIDVGGGTTDIALVRFRLEDRTERLGVPPQPYTGRDYGIVPTLRGSSGKSQRGGNFLTLRVFHWLKAAIADLVLRSAAISTSEVTRQWSTRVVGDLRKDLRDESGYLPGSLLTRTLAVLRQGTAGPHAEDSIGDRELAEDVERVVPTHYRPEEPLDKESEIRAHNTFQRLWGMAEQVKLTLNEQGTMVLDDLAIRPVVDLVFGRKNAAKPEIFEGLELSQEILHDITRPMLVEIADLAFGLAKARLDGPDDRLDRILLTGKASMTPLLQTVIRARFAEREGVAAFESVEIVGEKRFAKNAASIGAAWAAMVRGYHLSDDEVRDVVAHGGTDVDIDIDNLFRNLPYRLIRGGTGDHNALLFRAGAEFPRRKGGRAWLRSGHRRLRDGFTVLRVVEGGTNQEWGTFKYEALLSDAEKDPSSGYRRTPGVWPEQIWAQVEVDDQQDLRLHLWRGTQPSHEVGDKRATGVLDVAARLLVQDVAFDLAKVAGRISVNKAAGTDDGGGSRVFTPPAPGPSGEVAWHRFVDDGGAELDGIIAARPLPDPPRNGNWTFYLDEDGRTLELGNVTAPADASFGSYWATLDEKGVLRVHPDQPPYWAARDVAEVEDQSGRVLTLPISVARQSEIDPDDPYNGRQ